MMMCMMENEEAVLLRQLVKNQMHKSRFPWNFSCREYLLLLYLKQWPVEYNLLFFITGNVNCMPQICELVSDRSDHPILINIFVTTQLSPDFMP